MELEKFKVLSKVHQDRLETKTKRIGQLDAEHFKGKRTPGLDLLKQTIDALEGTTNVLESIIAFAPTKEVISCSMDVTAEVYRFLEAFADGMIEAMEYDEKQKGGKK